MKNAMTTQELNLRPFPSDSLAQLAQRLSSDPKIPGSDQNLLDSLFPPPEGHEKENENTT